MKLHDHLDFGARMHPDRELAVLGDVRMTYADGADHVARLAGAIARSGLPSGSRVAYLSKNSLEFGLFYFAASKAGVVPVPLNYRLAPREWAYIVEDSGAPLVFAQQAFADGIDAIRPDLTAVQRTVLLDGPPDGERVGWERFDDWLGEEPIAADAVVDRSCEDVYQMYTSGTTGRPKGVVFTQDALLCVLAQWRLAIPMLPNERELIVAPMYHVSGSLFTFHAVASSGSMQIYTDFDAVEVARALDEDHIGFVFLVPAMIQAILTGVEGATERSYPDLRTILYGASPIAEAALARAIDVFGCDFVQAFGMTEIPNLTYLTPDDHRLALAGRPELLLSAGRAGPGAAVRIIDPDDPEQRPVPPGVVGEICGRGGQVMSRYWNLPEATTDALAGGWMHTGDAGFVDENGYLFIKDRIKDMISSGGENVYPREVEDVLFEHPAVADVAVIGVPSEQWGETVHAVVVLRAGHDVDDRELIEFCRDRIAGYKRPRSIAFVDELPRNPSGKVLKRELRDAAWAGHGRAVG